jgi:GNAT superfamily N-acetyltransferase
MSMEVRPARPADRQRILDISARTWDSHNYVPLMLDEWLAGAAGELLVAVLDGGGAAFSYQTWVADGHAWLQGIRTDTALRGKGLGGALTKSSIESSRADGARRIGLSTYIDNHASTHSGAAFPSFLGGEPDDLLTPLRHAQAEPGAATWEATAPKERDRSARALAVLRESGLRSGSGFGEDVFSYELDPAAGPSREAQNVEGRRVQDNAG